MINWFDACAYAQWLSQKEQKAWRLPTEWEWEKSARGTDGRAYPWGDFFDPSWCCNRLSHQGSPQVVGIDQFPTDQSPYGVMGMGGNIAEWCLDPHEDDVSHYHSAYLSKADIEKMLAIPPHSIVARTAKGGAWDDGPMFCRSAVRHRGVSSYRRASLGFRLCRSIE